MQELTPNPIPDDMIYDPIDLVMKYTNISRTGIYAAVKAGDFPAPYQFGPRMVRFKRAEVLDWMESRPRGTRIANTQRKKVAA